MVEALDEVAVQNDLPQALQLLKEMNNNVKQVTNLVENVLVKVKNGELSTENGLSFLEVKYHMLLDYLINLTYVVLRKSSGEQINQDPVIDRLIELRTYLEKIRPIDFKLRYQIDKLVKAAVTGGSNSNDLISFKPNPNSLTSQLPAGDVTSSESDSENEKNIKKKVTKSSKSSSNIYVPPKLSAVNYDGDETKAERSRKELERAKKLAYNSSIIQDLKEEYLDTPVEYTSSSRAQQMFSKAQREKEEYEEKYLTRLPITKAEKHKQRKLTTVGGLGSEITTFSNISALEGELSSVSNKRKKKIPSKKRGNKKRKFH